MGEPHEPEDKPVLDKLFGSRTATVRYDEVTRRERRQCELAQPAQRADDT